MTIRTSERTVIFRRPFILDGFDEELPAGSYSVETDEELIEGVSFPAYRRTQALIRLPTMPGNPGLTRTLAIDPNVLDAALMRDQSPEGAPVGQDGNQETPEGTVDPRGAQSDALVIERSEGEGTVAHQG
jgi:hypothetical protein